MKLPRVRFTVRRMMVVVAVLSVLLGSALWLDRRVRAYRGMAEFHSARRWRAVMIAPPGTAPRGVDGKGEVTSYERERWHLAMEEKYKRAVRFPWLPVAPDPPEPK